MSVTIDSRTPIRIFGGVEDNEEIIGSVLLFANDTLIFWDANCEQLSFAVSFLMF
jgi:hypothetical protein